MSFIGIDIRADENIKTLLDKMPGDIQDAATDEVMKYLQRVEQEYPPYQYVTRAQAYPTAPAGPGWFSDKQRKYVMARIRKGEITPGTPRRTQNFRRGWKIIGKGKDSLLVNEVPYGPYLKDDMQQARHMFLIGWTILSEDIRDRTDKIMLIIGSTAKKVLKQKGKK
jgi:hypothetical protein